MDRTSTSVKSLSLIVLSKGSNNTTTALNPCDKFHSNQKNECHCELLLQPSQQEKAPAVKQPHATPKNECHCELLLQLSQQEKAPAVKQPHATPNLHWFKTVS